MCKLGGEASLIVRSERTRKLVSGRAEDLVFKVARREDARRRSGEKIRTVHLGRTRGRDRRDLANSGVRRIKAQVLGVQSREARGEVKWREIYSRPSGGTGGERSRDLVNSGVRRLRVQTLGTPSREVAR
jgi:hypothetical protein